MSPIAKSAFVGERAIVGEGATVGEGAFVGERATVPSGAIVGPRCEIGSTNIATISPVGSRRAVLTGVRTNDGRLLLTTGCRTSGTPVEEFREYVRETHGQNAYAQEYERAIGALSVYLTAIAGNPQEVTA